MDNTVYAMAARAQEAGLTGITHFTASAGNLNLGQHDGYGLKEVALNAGIAANTPAQEAIAHLAALDRSENTSVFGQTVVPQAEQEVPSLTKSR